MVAVLDIDIQYRGILQNVNAFYESMKNGLSRICEIEDKFWSCFRKVWSLCKHNSKITFANIPSFRGFMDNTYNLSRGLHGM